MGSDAYTRIYSYDSVGNRLIMTNGINTTSYTYNNLNQLTQSIIDGVWKSYVYDNNGNLSSKGIASFIWNYEKLLTETGLNSYVLYILGFQNLVQLYGKVKCKRNTPERSERRKRVAKVKNDEIQYVMPTTL